MARSIYDIISATIGTPTAVYTDVETDSIDAAVTLIARANPNRFGLTIVNIADEVITIGTDERVRNGRGIKLVPNGSFATSLLFDYSLPSSGWYASAATLGIPIYTIEVIGTPDLLGNVAQEMQGLGIP